MLKTTSMRMFHNGVDVGPVEDISFSYSDGKGPLVEGSVPAAGFDFGPVTTSCTSTIELHGRAARSLLRFVRIMSRAATPYARCRGLKKPRGRHGKARARHMWWRDAERRLVARAQSAALLGITKSYVPKGGPS